LTEEILLRFLMTGLVDFDSLPVQRLDAEDASDKAVPRGKRSQRPVAPYRSVSARLNGGESSRCSTERSKPEQDAGARLSSGAALFRAAASAAASCGNAPHGGLLEDEEFDPAMLAATLDHHLAGGGAFSAVSSSSLPSRPRRWTAADTDGGEAGGPNSSLRWLSPTRQPVGRIMQRPLSELYVEVVRHGRSRSRCLQCSETFEVGQLQVGYTAHTLFPQQPARWIHVACMNDARLNIRAGSCRVSLNPRIPAAIQQEIMSTFVCLSMSPGPHELRKWTYLRASVKHWDSSVLPELCDDVRDASQTLVGDALPQRREREVSGLLALLPSYPLTVDLDDEDSTCAICQVKMNMGDMVCRLPCHHVYHVGCIDTWLRVKTSCPLDNLCIEKMLQQTPPEPTAGTESAAAAATAAAAAEVVILND